VAYSPVAVKPQSTIANLRPLYFMDAITALHSRNSVNLLTEPGPTREQLQDIIKAGLRACDHKDLRPWRYLLIEGDARYKLGPLLVAAKAVADGVPVPLELVAKLNTKPFRAPTIIAIAAHITFHPKVPEIEQILSAGASAQMMMAAAHALGVGAIWRSGSPMFTQEMRDGLGFEANDQLIGFLYLGTPKARKELPDLDPADFLRTF
jgi:nitroreductase